MSAKADLHVHSKFSDQPSAWLLRQFGAPESYTEPAEVYRLCRERGMTHVTLADHNTLRGALEIAHLPGVFLSSEVTATFPEDGCPIHLLVLGVSESEFAEIDRLRENLYDLRDYLDDRSILHSVAHPLFRVSERFKVEHFEKLLLLFKRFEVINGARDPLAGNVVQVILDHLTPSFLEQLAHRHGIDPRDAAPWRKFKTGGSDDHGGLHIAAAYTETPSAETTDQFLEHLRRGDHRPAGAAGSSLKLAHSFARIAHQFLARRQAASGSPGHDVFTELLGRIVDEREKRAPWSTRVRTGLSLMVLSGRARLRSRDAQATVELLRVVSDHQPSPHQAPEERCFELANELTSTVVATAIERAARELAASRPAGAFRHVASAVPGLLGMVPYLAAFHTQHKDDAFLRELGERFPAVRNRTTARKRLAWFSDTLGEVNGVARMIRATLAAARERGADIRLIAPDGDTAEIPEILRFEPVASFAFPGYESIPVVVPPFLELLAACERQEITEILISTPGPVGLAGLAIGRLLGLPVSGVYHTDFPAYARHLTASPVAEALAWSYMRWFFGACEHIFAPSRATAEQLTGAGFEPAKISILPRGVDTEQFHPGWRQRGFWSRYGLSGACTFLFVGRVAKEKNLDQLLTAFQELLARGFDADLAIVGDGPYREDLARRFAQPRVVFTGFLHGDELARAYASADVFVFPSTTETFGNVVLEAQASRLPAIVAAGTAPAELVTAAGAGMLYDPHRRLSLTEAMESLFLDAERRLQLGTRGVLAAEEASWEAIFQTLWSRDGGNRAFPNARRERHLERVSA